MNFHWFLLFFFFWKRKKKIESFIIIQIKMKERRILMQSVNKLKWKEVKITYSCLDGDLMIYASETIYPSLVYYGGTNNS